MQATQHIIDNFLRHIYCTLKEKDRYVEEGWSRTNYEAIFDTINEAFFLLSLSIDQQIQK